MLQRSMRGGRGDGGKVSRFSFSGTDCGCVGERRGGRVAGETYLSLKLWLFLRLLLWLCSCGFDKGTTTATAKDAAVAATYFSMANTQILFYKGKTWQCLCNREAEP